MVSAVKELRAWWEEPPGQGRGNMWRPPLRLRATHLTSPYFSFLDYKSGVMTVRSHGVVVKTEGFSICHLVEQCLIYNNMSFAAAVTRLPRRLQEPRERSPSQRGSGRGRGDVSEDAMHQLSSEGRGVGVAGGGGGGGWRGEVSG